MNNLDTLRTIIIIICIFPSGWLIRSLFLLHKPKYKWWYFVVAVVGLLIGLFLLDNGT